MHRVVGRAVDHRQRRAGAAHRAERGLGCDGQTALQQIAQVQAAELAEQRRRRKGDRSTHALWVVEREQRRHRTTGRDAGRRDRRRLDAHTLGAVVDHA